MHRFKNFGGGMFAALLMASFAVPSAAAQQTGEITVRVQNTVGEAVEEVDVRILGLGRSQHLEAGEAAHFENIPVGSYLVEAESVRDGRGVERVRIEAGVNPDLIIRVSLFFHSDDIVVSVGAQGTQSELYSPSNVVQGIDLRATAEASLGETLSGEPGVSSTYHGPGSSRPIIRGLGGDRVRILESGVGTGDASSTSADHAPGVEVMMADRIEVLRGPATLLFGSSAIGGVVNIEDGRIPQELPAHPLTGSATLRGSTVSEELNGAARLDGAAGPVAFHASGLIRNTDDYSIPGFADAEHDPDAPPEPGETEGVLENSALETSRFAGGVSYVGSSGYIGLAYSGYDTEYGVPGGHPHSEEEEDAETEAGDVKIDLRQRRWDAESELRFGGRFVKGLQVRFGIADYRHFEVIDDEATGDRVIETTFNNDEWEGRLELQHSLGGSSTGAFGVQIRNRDFEAIGEEAFVPPTSTGEVGVFLFEQFSAAAIDFQAGARYERQSSSTIAPELDRDYTGLSASLGAIIPASEAVSFVVNAARSANLPSPEELYSDGPHLATLQFERGDPDLDQEIGYSLDAGVRFETESVGAELSFFSNSFDGFIYQLSTGEIEDDLPVSQWTQDDAVFRGFEFQTDVEVLHAGDGHVVIDAFSDFVWAELSDSGDPLPRIPPLRLGVGVGYESTGLHGRVGATRVTAQDRVSDFEEPTDGYTMLDARIGVRLFRGRTVHDIVLSGTNLLDQEARSHTSFIKQFAPLPGRDLRLTYQVSF